MQKEKAVEKYKIWKCKKFENKNLEIQIVKLELRNDRLSFVLTRWRKLDNGIGVIWWAPSRSPVLLQQNTKIQKHKNTEIEDYKYGVIQLTGWL